MSGNALRRWLDIPPFWLLFSMVSVWIQGRIFPMGMAVRDWVSPVAGWVLCACAAGVTLAAVVQMRRFRTTVHPHDNASFLVTTGVFKFSRNPIYLSDVLVLLAMVIWAGTGASMIIVVAFVCVLQHRFIRIEEQRLKALFPSEWTEYRNKTRRWI